jgi:hypothetical protein
MNIKKIIQLGLTSILLISSLLSNTVYAQIGEKTPEVDDLLYKFTSDYTTEATTTDYVASLPEDAAPGHIIGQIVYYLLIVANVLAFVSFVVAGIFMVVSQGNEDENTKAKKILTYTVLALIICAAALAIVTGVTQLNFFRP